MWYVIGRVRLKPGRRESFLRDFRAYRETSRKDEGCIYFEMAAGSDDPDTVVIIECFTTRDAHQAHLNTAHYAAGGPRFQADLLEADFEDIGASDVKRTHFWDSVASP